VPRSRLGSPWGGLSSWRQEPCEIMGLSLPLPHYPALLRARREIIPSCSGVTGTMEGGVRATGCIVQATPPPPVRRGRFTSPLSVGWMSCCPHPPTTTTRHTFYLTHFTAEGEGLRRSRVGPGSTPRGFNPAVRAFGRAAGPGSTPRGAGVQPGGRTPIPQLVKNLQQK